MINFETMSAETVPQLWLKRQEIFQNSFIDMTSVKEIDSAGIAFLIQWSKSLKDKKLCLKYPPQAALRLIATFGLQPIFEIEN